MSKSAKDYNYPLRLPAADAIAVNKVCRQSRASFNRIVTLCVRKALPVVAESLAAESGRITNVDPLPVKVSKKLYRQRDDDTASINLFMAAQVKSIEE
jgi:hypothetical protein